MIGWLICKVTQKHKRGKRWLDMDKDGKQAFRCPRCGNVHYRAPRPAKVVNAAA